MPVAIFLSDTIRAMQVRARDDTYAATVVRADEPVTAARSARQYVEHTSHAE
jgi:hypothetical protein